MTPSFFFQNMVQYFPKEMETKRRRVIHKKSVIQIVMSFIVHATSPKHYLHQELERLKLNINREIM